MKFVKNLVKETNFQTETQSQRKEVSNRILEDMATCFGVPKTAVSEYAVVLLHNLVKEAKLHQQILTGKERFRLSFRPQTIKD